MQYIRNLPSKYAPSWSYVNTWQQWNCCQIFSVMSLKQASIHDVFVKPSTAPHTSNCRPLFSSKSMATNSKKHLKRWLAIVYIDLPEQNHRGYCIWKTSFDLGNHCKLPQQTNPKMQCDCIHWRLGWGKTMSVSRTESQKGSSYALTLMQIFSWE